MSDTDNNRPSGPPFEPPFEPADPVRPSGQDPFSDSVEADTPPPHLTPPPPSDHDMPPPERQWDVPDDDSPPHGPPSDGGSRTLSDPYALVDVTDADQLREDALVVLRRVLGSCNDLPKNAAAEIITLVRSQDRLFDLLEPDVQRTYNGVFEVLEHELSVLSEAGTFHVDTVSADEDDLLSVARVYHRDVQAELDRIADAGHNEPLEEPTRAVLAFVERVQRNRTLYTADRLKSAIVSGATRERLLKLFTTLEPPTTTRNVENISFSKTAAEWEQEALAVAGAGEEVRISSGYPTLDRANTMEGEAVGSFGLGEFWVVAAGTGHGKSSFMRRLLPAAAEDLRNWGLGDAKAVLAFTEEEAPNIARTSELGRNQRFHHLSDSVQLVDANASRTRLAESLYEEIRQAFIRSQETGLPPTEFLPYIYILDYIGGVAEEGENPDTTAIQRSADLLMRGFAKFNPDAMAKFSGVDFRSYAGMPWPEGLEHHRMAVIVAAQLKKQDGSTLYYSGEERKMGPFTVDQADGRPAWQPRPGDYRVPTRDEVRGSGVLLNHATGLIFLHRSKPENNPVLTDPVTGRVHLGDTRSRFILPKTRNGASLPCIPMRFDSNPAGNKGMFYDDLAEQALNQGRFDVADCFTQSGDPLLPVRDRRSPFAGIRY